MKNRSPETKLKIALALTAVFAVVEVIGGTLSGSLALLSDAAHMFTDVSALVIALTAIQLSKRVADVKRTFGYYRFEILAAVLNAVILILVAIYIFIEAYHRINKPTDIHIQGMFIIASIGLAVNLIGIKLLHHDSHKHLNVKGAYLEAWADMLGAVGVITAAIIIQFTGWRFVDSIIAIAIGLWVLPRAWTLLKESLNILLEGVPEGIELNAIHTVLSEVKGVLDVHDLHVWALTSGKISLTVHLIVEENNPNIQTILNSAAKLLEERFEITHTTIQLETNHCGHDDLGKLDRKNK